MTEKELKQILENHIHWLKEDCIGWEEMRADLSDADLSNANLRYANLRYADLSDADLSDADLSYANLAYANLSDVNLSNAKLSYASLNDINLSDTDLRRANLRCANLRCANLISADLSNADLISADLSNADLSNADLISADLSNANLRHADLRHADLRYADLSYANLSYANLSYAKNVPYIPMICPEEGDFIGWKVANKKIVKLYIPDDALRSSATTRKCRCNKAEVVEIYNLDGTIAEQRCVKSDYNNDFVYKVGETVIVDNFDKERWNECSSGIHFFLNRQEAINYDLS